MDIMTWANSPTLLLLCSAALLVVAMQSVIYIRRAWKEALLEGFTKDDLKKMIYNSALSSILPTLSTIIFLIMLAPLVGKYFAWLRLSVLGSGTYEYMAADAATKAMGFTSLTDTGLTLSVYITIMWAMSLGISGGPIVNTLFFQPYYERLQSATLKKSGFGQFVGMCLMMTMMTVMLVPRVLDYKNPLSMSTTIFVSFLVVILDRLGEKKALSWLKDFSFPISLLSGFVFAIILGNTVFVK